MSDTTTASAIIEDLVRRAALGETQAQEEILRRYQYLIRRAVRQRLGRGLRSREETSDLEQLASMEVLRSLRGQKWQGKRAFLGWLRRVAAGEVIDKARYHQAARRQSNKDLPIDEGRLPQVAASMESRIDEQRQLEQLERLLDELPDKQAQALVLFHQGHSHAEIGEVLEVSAEAARKLVARGRAKLVTLRGG